MPITTPRSKVDTTQEIPSYQVHRELAPKSPRPQQHGSNEHIATLR